MSVLLLVGQGKESPSVVDALLDVERNPRRPQYVMAADFPLNLFRCSYAEGEAQWRYEQEAVEFFTKQFQALWTEHQVQLLLLVIGAQGGDGRGVPTHPWTSKKVIPPRQTTFTVPPLQLTAWRLEAGKKIAIFGTKKITFCRLRRPPRNFLFLSPIFLLSPP